MAYRSWSVVGTCPDCHANTLRVYWMQRDGEPGEALDKHRPYESGLAAKQLVDRRNRRVSARSHGPSGHRSHPTFGRQSKRTIKQANLQLLVA